MILNGKCKEMFLEWKVNNKNLSTIEVLDFKHLSTTSQNALIIEFFDSVGLWSDIVNDTLILDRDYFKKCSWESNIKLLIITANDIYNERYDINR